MPEDIKAGKALRSGKLAKDLTPVKDGRGKAVKGFRGGAFDLRLKENYC